MNSPNTMRDSRQRVIEAFRSWFGEAPAALVRAPGRVNLIGEHTDYNDGFVLPLAIDRVVWIALRPREDDRVQVQSLDYGEVGSFALSDFQLRSRGWLRYLQAVAWALGESGHRLRGWEGVFAGDVPIGAGLSSSAALELATARAFCAVAAIAWDPRTMAVLSQKAENQWVGVNCGVMDQMISAAGTAGHALLIDCRSLAAQAVPMPEGTAVVVMDTATRRGLVDSAYNERRRQCEDAARFFGVPALRDVEPVEWKARSQRLDPQSRMRARHVITENARTQAAAEALRQGDPRRVGELMDLSHASLRDDFEVSCDELDRMVEAAREHPGCYGARMTGAGFGGCAVALVDQAAAEGFVCETAERYRTATGLRPTLYVCRASQGASVEMATLRSHEAPTIPAG
jgi:galactokinase